MLAELAQGHVPQKTSDYNAPARSRFLCSNGDWAMKKILGVSALVVLGLGMGSALVACGSKEKGTPPPEVQAQIAERIAPEGEIVKQGAAAPAASGAARSGEEVFQAKCGVCHTPGVGGAPKVGSAGDWAPRIGQGMDTLYANAIKGIRGMPPKGLCMDCSDAELNAAVDYMVEKSK
jgi:cytochrome c5